MEFIFPLGEICGRRQHWGSGAKDGGLLQGEATGRIRNNDIGFVGGILGDNRFFVRRKKLMLALLQMTLMERPHPQRGYGFSCASSYQCHILN